MKIRKYLAKDKKDIRRICLETCSDKFLLENTDILFLKYADYYCDNESDNIFVCADEKDRCQGYILCSADPEKYKKFWKENGLNKLKGIQKLLQKYSLFESNNMNKKGYPAHMHIDISPKFQHNGMGAKLLNELLKHLKEKKINGLYLGCSSSNEIGNKFYQKMKFDIHHKIPGCNIYVIKP